MTADIVESAKAFATLCHANQMHGSRPYIEHCERVVKILVEHGYTDADLLAAAWLHDVVEDCGIDRGVIAGRFTFRTADLVWACTGEGSTRKARNESIRWKLFAQPDAVQIKLADRIDNVRSCIENGDARLTMYRNEHAAFRCIAPYPRHRKMLAVLDALISHRVTVLSERDSLTLIEALKVTTAGEKMRDAMARRIHFTTADE